MARSGLGLNKHPVVNIAYAVEVNDAPITGGNSDGQSEVTFVFKGATEALLTAVFGHLCSTIGIAHDFRIFEDAEPKRRQGHPYRRWNVELINPNIKTYGIDGMSLLVGHLLQLALDSRYKYTPHAPNRVDRYDINDFLNLSGRDPRLIINNKEHVKSYKEESMPNIYIRLPWYVASYYRGLEEDNPLSVWQPIQFKDYTHEWTILANNLRYIPEQRLSMVCLSQKGWNNILHGRKPEGGRTIIDRNSNEWPTIQEICALEGKSCSNAQRTLDYLCVEMPRVVIQNGNQVKPNQCYALDYDIAFKFRQILCQEFYHVFLDWVEQDERFCNRMGIHRKNLEVMERFLVQYNIPISVDQRDQDSLRRMRNRWMANAKKRPNDRVNFGSVWLEHISEDDRKRAEAYKKKK